MASKLRTAHGPSDVMKPRNVSRPHSQALGSVRPRMRNQTSPTKANGRKEARTSPSPPRLRPRTRQVSAPPFSPACEHRNRQPARANDASVASPSVAVAMTENGFAAVSSPATRPTARLRKARRAEGEEKPAPLGPHPPPSHPPHPTHPPPPPLTAP